MKAVIMAGGRGQRLFPLTEYAPKPLARLCGRPALEYIFDWLEKNGVVECVLALGCGAKQIRAYCAGHPRALRIRFYEEAEPLGTAGCVRRALSGAGPVLVVSGDALCDFPLRRVINAHESGGAAVTVVTARAVDPREYGLVTADNAGRITGFVEKPAFSQACGEMVNTGIYVLSAQAVECLPERGDFAADFFPRLLRDGMPLRACAPKGYWRDIGGPESYRMAHRDLLDGLMHAPESAMSPPGRYTVCPPVWLGKDVSIGDGAVVGPWAVLDDGCSIGAGCRVSGSVLLPGTQVGAGAVVRESIVCAGASVRSNALLTECAVGEKARVGARTRIGTGVLLPGDSRIPADESILEPGGRRAAFGDEGLCGPAGETVTPELATRLGCAVGSLAAGTVGVGCCEGRAGRVLADAVMAGLRSTGTAVMAFSGVFEAAFHFGMRVNALSLGVYVDEGKQVLIRLIGESGLPVPRAVEREVERRMAQGSYRRAACSRFGNRMDLSGIGVLYATELLRMAPDGLEGMRAGVVSETGAAQRLLADTLRRMGCREGGIRLELSPDGTRLSMSQDGIHFGPHRTVAAYGRLLFARQQDLAVENDFPRALDRFAACHGRQVLRYLKCPADGRDEAARRLAARQLTRDGLALAVVLLADLHKRGITLEELDREIPVFEVRAARVALAASPARILSRLGGEETGEGILLRDGERGTVLVRAQKNGGALRVFAEASNWETAAELCADTVQHVRRLMQAPGTAQSARAHALDNRREKRYNEQ